MRHLQYHFLPTTIYVYLYSQRAMASNSTPMTANPALATPRAEEPASEWASSTLSALEPSSNAQSSQEPGSHSAATTPGLNVPGSFPGQYPKPGAVQQDVQYAKDAAWSALETARGYAQNAAETAGGYLPASVSAYLRESYVFTTSLLD